MARLRFRNCLGASVLSLLLAGTAVADSEASRYYEDAVQRFQSRDAAGAIIQLKNAIQRDRQMLAAHVLLGRALLAEGDAQGAEVAFEEALRLGVNRSEVVVPLGQAYLFQGKYERLLDRLEAGGLPAPQQAEVLLLRSSAHLERGNATAALRALDDALAVQPGSTMVQLARVTVLLRSGQAGAALPVVDELVKRSPEHAGVWDARASLLHMRGDVRGALDAYGRSIALQPANINARIARAGLLLDAGRLDEALLDVDEVRKLSPREPRAAYLRALISSRKGNDGEVKAALTDVVRLLDPVPVSVLGANKQMLLLAAMAHVGLGNFEKARGYLTNYTRMHPKELGPAKILASIYIGMGQHRQAISLLEPFYKAGTADPRALSMLASAYMTVRQFSTATEVLEQAVRVSGGAPQARAELGVSLMGMGQREQSIEQFEQAFAKDPGQAQSGVALSVLYMKQQQNKKALATIVQVVKRHPDNLSALALLGAVRASLGDQVGARQAYEDILRRDARYSAAVLNLAKIDLAEGKADAAQARLAQLLKREPKNASAMYELALVEEQRGNLTAAVNWLEKARAVPAGRQRAGIQLADLHLRNRNLDSALSVAKDLVARAPEDVDALGALARIQLASADQASARQTLNGMARLAGYDAPRQVDIARWQRQAKNDAGALHSLEKALSGDPAYLPALLLQGETLIATQDFGRAEALIGQLGRQADRAHLAQRLRGDLDLARGNAGAALNNYRGALAKAPEADTALRIYRTHLVLGESAKGLAFLEGWDRQHPGDPATGRVIGDAHLRQGNLAAARQVYEKLQQRQPADPDLANNLAQTLLRQGDSAALAQAERAVRLVPGEPAYLDTLGWVLVQQGRIEQGIGHLRDARLRLPNDPEIRYHLAVALHKLGRSREAGVELEAALAVSGEFAGAEEARRLQRDLVGR